MIAGRSRPRPEPTTIEIELRGGRRGLAAEQVLDDRLALAGRDLLVGQGVAQLVAALVRCGRSGTARPRPRRACPRRGRPRTAPRRSRRCGWSLEVGAHDAAPDSGDEVLDQLLLRLASSSDSATTCSAARGGQLGRSRPQLVAAGPGPTSMSALGLGLELGDLRSSRARPSLERGARPARRRRPASARARRRCRPSPGGSTSPPRRRPRPSPRRPRRAAPGSWRAGRPSPS